MTKREILIAICEMPGWQPSQPVGQQTELYLQQLQSEGWIAPRLDGWEATHLALENYPRFDSQLDIADPGTTLRGVPAPDPAPTEELLVTPEHEDRVALFIHLLLQDHLTERVVWTAVDLATKLESHPTLPVFVYPRALARKLLGTEEE